MVVFSLGVTPPVDFFWVGESPMSSNRTISNTMANHNKPNLSLHMVLTFTTALEETWRLLWHNSSLVQPYARRTSCD